LQLIQNSSLCRIPVYSGCDERKDRGKTIWSPRPIVVGHNKVREVKFFLEKSYNLCAAWTNTIQ
jgi:hypothetical protein